MGTRSLTAVKDGKDEIMLLYRQMDGYPEGHGKELAEFLKDFHICNGFGSAQEKGKWANGMGCLAAQIVKHFKDGIGQFYLVKPGTRDHGEEYIYTLTAKGDKVNMAIKDVYDKKTIYNGEAGLFSPLP